MSSLKDCEQNFETRWGFIVAPRRSPLSWCTGACTLFHIHAASKKFVARAHTLGHLEEVLEEYLETQGGPPRGRMNGPPRSRSFGIPRDPLYEIGRTVTPRSSWGEPLPS